MVDALSQFRDAMHAAGLEPPEVIEPGKLHRFPGIGKRNGNTAGWCKLFDDALGGYFGDWSSGFSENWQAKREKPFTSAERATFRRHVVEARAQVEAERKAKQAKAAARARTLWNAATPAPDDHPHLVGKGIKANGARLHKGALLIPMRENGELQSLQVIGPSNKRFLSSGRVTGCHFSIGNPEGAAALCIAEGFATGATVHEATGYPVVVAFNAGNLGPVAKAMRERFPDLPLIVCADDDAATEGNPGLTKGTEAARSVAGLVAIPDFGTDRRDGATDFNDMATLFGLEAVGRAIVAMVDVAGGKYQLGEESALAGDSASQNGADAATSQADSAPAQAAVTPVTDVQASNGADSAVTAAVAPDVTDVTGDGVISIPENDRPCFKVFDAWTVIRESGANLRPGVWFFGLKAGKKADDPPTLTQQWICSPLHIEAVTFDRQDNNFGRLLRFRNTLGRWREWAMPMELLRGYGDELRGELLAMGVEIDPQSKTLLAQYLQAKPPKRRMHCALQVGCCGDSFVLPDEVIGAKAAGVIFQSGERGHDEHTRAGTLAGWQSGIAARAVGNPMLILALSASFAGPMLARCNAEGGGLHFVNDSSTGKTTLIEAACSSWGGPNFRRSWRATANGMEGVAALFNDCLLALDEISECDPKEVGAIVYALGNGRGKQRESRTGNARSVTRWRCFVLSSGERTIPTHMLEGGHRAKAGQSVRLLDIPAARRFGAWDELHGLPSGTAFSDAIKRAGVAQHGHAGRAFLQKLTRDVRDFSELLERVKALPEVFAASGEGQDKRAAARFALLALSGEVATEYGITGWPEGAAIEAAAAGFKAWQSLRGRGNDERRQILERVSAFIERHGDSRFSEADSDATADAMRLNWAGWWRDDGSNGRVYLFNSDGLREALKGFDFRAPRRIGFGAGRSL